jgi:hypothetical protein
MASRVATIAFTISWRAGPPRPACPATTTAPGGVWTCQADLTALGALPGPLTLGFDIVDTTGAVSHEPAGTRTVMYAVAPPKPTDTTYKFVQETPSKDMTSSVIEYRATWVEQAGFATEFRAYELMTCLRYSAKTDGQPCVVPGMTIPAGTLRLIGTVSGDVRSMKITWQGSPDGLTSEGLYGVLIQASNEYGVSKFAILDGGAVCFSSSCAY